MPCKRFSNLCLRQCNLFRIVRWLKYACRQGSVGRDYYLADETERSLSEIEKLVPDLSQSALSNYLGRLRQAEIVRARRTSQKIYYSIEDQNLVRILGLLKHIYAEDPALHKQKSWPVHTAFTSLYFESPGRIYKPSYCA